MFLSELLSLAAAACIAVSGMLISELKGRVDVIRLARWQMIAAFAMTATAAVFLSGGIPQIGAREAGLLALSSLFGIAIASTTYLAAIHVTGPRTTALLFTLASPFSLLLGYLFLGETITLMQAGGVALVLGGILLAIGPRRRETVPAVEGPAAASEAPAAAGITRFGLLLGVITALGQALGSLFARPAMEAGVEPVTAMAVRSGLGALFYLALILLPIAALNRPYVFRKGDLGIATVSAFVGAGLGMSLLMAALATGNVGIVTTLSSMTPIMILPMVWLRSGVRPIAAAWAGAGIAVAGTALISLGAT